VLDTLSIPTGQSEWLFPRDRDFAK
jgi:hypothetical protein